MPLYQENLPEEKLWLEMQLRGDAAAQQAHAAATFEAIFRLRDAVDRNARAAGAFAKSIRTLTVWLLVFTILIAVLASVLTWDVVKKLLEHAR